MDPIAPAISRRKVSPFAVICSWAAHASTYTHTTVALPSISWASDTSLSVHGYRVSVPHLGRRIAAEVRALEQLLKENLLLGLTPESLGFNITEATQIKDDLGITDPDYSMFSDPQLKDLRERLVKAFVSHPPAAFMFNRTGVVENPEAMFRHDGCAKWLERVNLVNRKIMLLIHMTGGQAGRGTELVGLRYTNSSCRRRGLYMVAPGLMAMLTFYSKMSSQTGKDRVIGHAIPWSLARLILIHRSLVLPLASRMKSVLSPDETLPTNMLSLVCTVNGAPVKADSIGGDLQNWFLEFCGHPIRWRTFRHLQIAISRKLMPGAYRTLQRVLNILDAQAGHTSEIAEDHYAVDGSKDWVIEHDTLYKYVVVSSWWWRIIFKNDPDMLTQRETNIGKVAASEITRLDAADSADLPDSVPAIVNALAALEDKLTGIAAKVREVRDLMLEWHTRVATTIEEALSRGKHLPPRPLPAATRPSKEPIKAKHLIALQLFCDNYSQDRNKVVWTSPQQAQAYIHTLERLHSLLVVLPTGGGKSLLFGAMPYQHKGVTIVIFPLRAVMVNQIASSIKRDPQRPHLEYDKTLQVTQGVVCVQIEKVDRDFLAWCQSLRERNLLARIVLDECHLVLVHKKFRKSMANVKPLLKAAVPLVCLTATLPPSHKEELRANVGGPSWKIIHAPTQRPNLSLRFARYRTQDDAFVALDEVLKKYNEETMPKKSGVLIIVPWKELADAVGKKYGIPVYHSDIDGKKDQDVVDWVDGKFGVIVGTTRLGTGVNKKHCLLVIHFGLPYGMTSYWQECGRAGRSGEPAMCLTIWWGKLRDPQPGDYEGQYAFNQMLMSTDCRRERISGYCDGSELVTTCFDAMDMCDRCEIDMQRERQRLGLAFDELEIQDYGIEPMPRGVLPARLLEFPAPDTEYSQQAHLVPASSPMLEPVLSQRMREPDDMDLDNDPPRPEDENMEPAHPELEDSDMDLPLPAIHKGKGVLEYDSDDDEMDYGAGSPISQAPNSPRDSPPPTPTGDATCAAMGDATSASAVTWNTSPGPEVEVQAQPAQEHLG